MRKPAPARLLASVTFGVLAAALGLTLGFSASGAALRVGALVGAFIALVGVVLIVLDWRRSTHK
jgi:uncharacterized membrane protein HdeD (DUF308 family)